MSESIENTSERSEVASSGLLAGQKRVKITARQTIYLEKIVVVNDEDFENDSVQDMAEILLDVRNDVNDWDDMEECEVEVLEG